VRPAEITLEVPHHAWARLLAEPGYEVELGTIGTLLDRTLAISLDLTTISKRHAHLSVRRSAEGRWVYTLHDTSRNGTWVNGQRVAGSCELAHDALIGLVGNTVVLQFSAFDRATLDAAPDADTSLESERSN
jgi:pSer/pThr/pTyr-binding forkhead associated (FHA) protein